MNRKPANGGSRAELDEVLADYRVEFRVQAVGGNQHRYLNSMTNYRHRDCLTAVVEQHQVQAIASLGLSDPVEELPGKLVSVSGRIQERDGQIQIRSTDLASQLKIVDSPSSENFNERR